jgi:hypothetical protein
VGAVEAGGVVEAMQLLKQRCCVSASGGDDGWVDRSSGSGGSGSGGELGAGAGAGAGAGSGVGVGPGIGLAAVRSHNSGLVLGLLRAAGAAGASRPELAGGTGLTPQAVSKITARLRAAGLVAEAGRQASTGGKPRTVLRLVPEAGYAAGLHLDRDELRAVLVDLAGRTVAERRAAIDFGRGAEAVVDAAALELGRLVSDFLGGGSRFSWGRGLGLGLGQGQGLCSSSSWVWGVLRPGRLIIGLG